MKEWDTFMNNTCKEFCEQNTLLLHEELKWTGFENVTVRGIYSERKIHKSSENDIILRHAEQNRGAMRSAAPAITCNLLKFHNNVPWTQIYRAAGKK